MRKQLSKRLGMADIRHTISSFCEGKISSLQTCEALQIGKTRLYQLRTDFLLAKGLGRASVWTPKSSGGHHKSPWPAEVSSFLKKVLSHHYSYAFAASEVLRLFSFKLDCSQIRNWALKQGIISQTPKPRPPIHTRRWQRTNVGELWQLDATTERWFFPDKTHFTLLNMIDDCSRLQLSCDLYQYERVTSYIHTLYKAFMKYGLPLQIYVDQASFFRASSPERLTLLGARLKFYDISFVLANSPEAKGKVERIHQVWQSRLPAYFQVNHLTAQTPLNIINEHLDVMRIHRNENETHREIADTPLNVWNQAIRQHPTKLRPVPKDPWWEYVWSDWISATVGPRGKVAFGNLSLPTQAKNGTRVWICVHVDNSFSVLANKPMSSKYPVVLFSSKP